MKEGITVAAYMEYLNAEKKKLANDFLDYIALNNLEKKQENVYNNLTLEELYAAKEKDS